MTATAAVTPCYRVTGLVEEGSKISVLIDSQGTGLPDLAAPLIEGGELKVGSKSRKRIVHQPNTSLTLLKDQLTGCYDSVLAEPTSGGAVRLRLQTPIVATDEKSSSAVSPRGTITPRPTPRRTEGRSLFS